MTHLILIISALAGLCALFVLLYFYCRRLDNYGFVDVAWAYAFLMIAIYFSWQGDGWGPRRAFIAGLAVLWSLRLGTHLLKRVAAHHPVEDGRYVQLRRDWGDLFALKMFGFFQLQALSVVLLSLPFLMPAKNPAPHFHSLEYFGIFIWLVALAGESLADAQLRHFKRNPANHGQVCTVGLWRYSRHPNYFFEWLVWVGFACFALASPFGWMGLLSPLAILYLLLRVTGIPLTEEQAVRSKGDAYRRYQQTTSPFVPWFPKQIS